MLELHLKKVTEIAITHNMDLEKIKKILINVIFQLFL